MVKDMTAESPLKLILQFSLPLLASNLVQQTYNVVDAAIVGRVLGADALACVGTSSSVQFLVLGFCMGLCSGFGVPMAMHFGGHEESELKKDVYHAAIGTLLFGAALTIVTALLTRTMLHALKTPDDIFEGAAAYLLILFLGIPFTLLYNLTASILRAFGNSRTPFLILTLSACANIFLDAFFIMVLHLGVEGAALATILSQGASGFLCLYIIIRRYPMLHPGSKERRLSWKRLGRLIGFAAPMGLQYSITAIGMMIMQAANNSLGSVYVSAFAAAMKIKQFAISPFDALATGAATFVSQNYGAAKPDRIRQGIRSSIVVSVLYGLGIGVILVLLGRQLSMLFLDQRQTAILDASAHYLRNQGLFFWVLGFLNPCRSCTQGLGYAGRAVYSGVIEMAARSIVALAFVPMAGFDAICLTDQAAWISASLYYCAYLHLVREKSGAGARRTICLSRPGKEISPYKKQVLPPQHLLFQIMPAYSMI